MAKRPALDRTFLAQAGLGDLSEDDQASLLKTLTVELESRVGTRLAASMSSTELQRFNSLTSEGDREAASRLLRRVVPWQSEAVHEEFDILAKLLTARAPEILAATGGRP